jgi:hypothetical protein
MSKGRAGRRWFVGSAVVAVAIAVGAGLAQPWASDSSSGRVQTGGSFPGIETEVIETGIELRYSVAGIVEWRGEVIALTGGGEVVRSRDGRAWEQVAASGFSPRTRATGEDGRACAGDGVRGVAARGDLLVAIGQRAVPAEPGDEYCDTRLEVWVSTDAATWNAVEPSGLADTDTVATVVADRPGFLAFGSSRVAERAAAGEEDEEEQGRGLTVWRSGDGVTWEAVPTEGLSRPTEHKYQSVNSVAVRGERMLAAAGVECVGCYDDETIALWRSDGVSTWQELTFTGLDALDQANSDIVPTAAATDDGYFAFASVGKEHSENRTPAAWFSSDGERWDERVLNGPSPSNGAMDAATSTRHGVVALDSTRAGLVVWRLEDTGEE